MKARFALFLLLFMLLSELSFAQSHKKHDSFTLRQPDFSHSPYTGMTRRHWIEAGEYLLKGAFDYIHTLDDQMDFPKQLEKTYPRNEDQIPVARLEGLARTLFIAAPLLKDNPELEMNGIKVADYYRHQLANISNPHSKSFIPHRKGGPSQILLELGSLAISMKAAQKVLWDALTKAQKDSLAATMLSYGEGPTIGSNWILPEEIHGHDSQPESEQYCKQTACLDYLSLGRVLSELCGGYVSL